MRRVSSNFKPLLVLVPYPTQAPTGVTFFNVQFSTSVNNNSPHSYIILYAVIDGTLNPLANASCSSPHEHKSVSFTMLIYCWAAVY